MPYLNRNVQNNYHPDIIFTDSSSSPQLEYEMLPMLIGLHPAITLTLPSQSC